MSIKFGQKQSMADKMSVAGRNKNPSGSKDTRPPSTKAKPIIGKDKVGFKITKKF